MNYHCLYCGALMHRVAVLNPLYPYKLYKCPRCNTQGLKSKFPFSYENEKYSFEPEFIFMKDQHNIITEEDIPPRKYLKEESYHLDSLISNMQDLYDTIRRKQFIELNKLMQICFDNVEKGTKQMYYVDIGPISVYSIYLQCIAKDNKDGFFTCSECKEFLDKYGRLAYMYDGKLYSVFFGINEDNPNISIFKEFIKVINDTITNSSVKGIIPFYITKDKTHLGYVTKDEKHLHFYIKIPPRDCRLTINTANKLCNRFIRLGFFR